MTQANEKAKRNREDEAVALLAVSASTLAGHSGLCIANDINSLRSFSSLALMSLGFLAASQGSHTNAVIWSGQLRRLVDSGRIANTIMKVGIPSDHRGYTKLLPEVGVTYLLAKPFDDTNNAYTGDHYEVYVNPRNDYLIDAFLKVYDLADAYKENIAFLAVRPTPGITRSRLNGKNLPRIIIGFNNAADKTRVAEFISQLRDVLKEQRGIGYRPRYSDEVEGTNKLIYVSKGSGDYKESKQGQEEYAPMKYTPETLWSRLRSKLTNNPDVEDMAYPDEQSRIETLPPSLNRWVQ